jgi:cobalt/nickel transport system permease protein
MLIGHLTFAGLAELAVTGGVMTYLERTSSGSVNVKSEQPSFKWKPALAVLAILIALTPLGLLSMGRAWGEWSASDFRNPDVRTQIQRASNGVAAPKQPPPGLLRFERFWPAPLRDYAPGFISKPWAGYVVSGITGVLLSLGVTFALYALLSRRSRHQQGEKSI